MDNDIKWRIRFNLFVDTVKIQPKKRDEVCERLVSGWLLLLNNDSKDAGKFITEWNNTTTRITLSETSRDIHKSAIFLYGSEQIIENPNRSFNNSHIFIGTWMTFMFTGEIRLWICVCLFACAGVCVSVCLCMCVYVSVRTKPCKLFASFPLFSFWLYFHFNLPQSRMTRNA